MFDFHKSGPVHTCRLVPSILDTLPVLGHLVHATATSTGDLPSGNILKARDSGDLGAVLSVYPLSRSACNFALFIMTPISRKDMCTRLAICLIELFSL